MGLPDFDPFMETSEGRALFPYHRFAPGYLIAPSDEEPLRRFLCRMRWGGIMLLAPYFALKPWLQIPEVAAFLIFVVLSMSVWFAAVAVRCRGLPRTHGPMPRLDSTRRAVAELPDSLIVFGLITCLLFSVGGIAMVWQRIGDTTMGVLTAASFGVAWLWYCRIAWMKWTAHS